MSDDGFFAHSNYLWLEELVVYVREWYGSRILAYITTILNEFIADPIWIHPNTLDEYKHDFLTFY